MASDTPSNPVALEDRVRDDAKLYSPSAARNRDAVRAVLTERLPRGARVIEIGSGTGEHGETCCAARPDIIWQLSETDADSLASCAVRAVETDGLLSPLTLDVSRHDWSEGLEAADALVCLNVIHIAPWRVAEGLAAGSAKLVAPGGVVYLYGPFLEGERTAASNLEFDQSLKSRNPEWGVRSLEDVEALFSRNGFALEERIEMPANNLSLIFRRPS